MKKKLFVISLIFSSYLFITNATAKRLIQPEKDPRSLQEKLKERYKEKEEAKKKAYEKEQKAREQEHHYREMLDRAEKNKDLEQATQARSQLEEAAKEFQAARDEQQKIENDQKQLKEQQEKLAKEIKEAEDKLSKELNKEEKSPKDEKMKECIEALLDRLLKNTDTNDEKTQTQLIEYKEELGDALLELSLYETANFPNSTSFTKEDWEKIRKKELSSPHTTPASSYRILLQRIEDLQANIKRITKKNVQLPDNKETQRCVITILPGFGKTAENLGEEIAEEIPEESWND